MPYKNIELKRKYAAEWKRSKLITDPSFKAKLKAALKKHRQSGKERTTLLNNPVRHEKQKAKQREYRQVRKDVYQNYEISLTRELHENYIKRQLRKEGICTELSNKYPELIEAKKLILKIKRFNYDIN